MTTEQRKYKFHYLIDSDSCMACGACELECKYDAVYVDDNADYAINISNCLRCGKCFRACPSDAIKKIMTPS
ncbi:MAG: 4Fe-4S binding protein [Peptococcaceae bacterium]|nr:4Fe-4S binding protein [Peptococcaceae bacterium]